MHDPNTVRRIVAAAGLDPGRRGAGGRARARLADPGAAAGRRARARRGDRPGARRRAAGDRRRARRPGRRPADRAPRATRCGVTAAELADPAPTALVANLPYNVAVPVVLHLLAELPSLRHGLVMVQKEVADRLAAGPGSKVYGIPSVKLAWYASARAGRQGAAERVLAGAQRRLRPGRLHPPRAAPRRRAPGARSSRWSTRRSRSAARRCAPRWPAGPAARTGRPRRSPPAGVDPGARGRAARPSSSSPPSPRRPAVAGRGRRRGRRRGADASRRTAGRRRSVTEAWRPDDDGRGAAPSGRSRSGCPRRSTCTSGWARCAATATTS